MSFLCFLSDVVGPNRQPGSYPDKKAVNAAVKAQAQAEAKAATTKVEEEEEEEPAKEDWGDGDKVLS